MLRIFGDKHYSCDGIARRSFVQAGLLGVGGLTLADWLALKASAETKSSGVSPTGKSVILLWMSGGPGHMETWDPKPDAVDQYRGPFGAIGSLASAALCGAGPYLLFRREAIGGGDVKLFAALGATAGLLVGLEGQLFAFILAALWAIVRVAAGGGLGTLIRNVGRLIVNPILPQHRRRALEPASLTSLRLGAFILTGVGLSVALRTLPGVHG